jgi:hypothetical protein
VPVFISPRNRLVCLRPQALGYIFIASHDSQGYSEDIRSRLHKDDILNIHLLLLLSFH